MKELIGCCNCVSRHGDLDEAGIRHCERFDLEKEKLCINRNHYAWQLDTINPPKLYGMIGNK